MFDLEVELGSLQSFATRVAGFEPRLRAALVKAVTRSTLVVETLAKQFVSGEVLQVRTGTLRRSITSRTEELVDRVLGIIGTNVPYARIQELGGIIQHPGGTAYIVVNGWAVFIANKDVAAFGGNLPRTRPHAIPIPERSYLRRALTESAPRIREELRAAVQEGAAFGAAGTGV